jgi:hypothetical protein
MTDFIRRLVSGNKARFKDSELGLELGKCLWLCLVQFLDISDGRRPCIRDRQNHNYGLSSNWIRRLL